MLSASRIKELTLFDFKHSLTSLKSLAYIISYFFFWYLVLANVTEHAVDWLNSVQGLFFASWLLDNQELAYQLFVNRPASLSVYMLVSLTVTPMFILLAANNQLSSDASSGAFRFILTRATRTELYISRYIAVALLVLISIFITSVWATVQAYMNKEEGLEAIVIFGIQTFIIVFIYNLPFIAFMSLISAITKTAFGSFFLGMMSYIFLLMLSLLLKDDFSYATYIIPSGIKSTLIDINPTNILISFTVLVAYTFFYYLSGWFVFKRRNI
ncbi:MAG: hypothetical protein MI865_00945 [Proteobacteria bacterium]|nr:hypothetical protein [Pseudomonadota bacterium]